MVSVKALFRCSECSSASAKWVGRCPGCEAWNTLAEEPEAARASAGRGLPPFARPVPIAEVDTGAWAARPTGIGELDRVLGGGLVPGSVTLVGGEPGIGKSTLLLQMVAAQTASGARALYVSAEESTQQVRLRAERVGALRPRLWLVSEGLLPHIIHHLDEVHPDILVVDSVQTIYDPELGPAPGSVTQVRQCAHRLVQEAKARGVATVLVGHVTKDGGLAGPRVLEHVVDTVLAFEGDRHHALRLLRAVKHRFGSAHELGLFEMGELGLTGVPDASGLFLADRHQGVTGSVVVPTMEGHRPLLVELQGLVVGTAMPSPRRSAKGVDGGRLAFLLAVLEQRAGLALGQADVYTLAVGGVNVVEPGADLALALAIVSSLTDQPLASDLVACGEVGLGGELRQVGQMPRRLAEAARLGFTRAVVGRSAPDPPPGIDVVRASTVTEAIGLVGLAVR